MPVQTFRGDRMKARIGISQIALVLGVLAIATAGCGSSSSTSSAPSTSTTAKKTVKTVATKSPCEEAAPTPASPGEVGAGAGGSAAVNSAASVAAEEHGVRGKVPQLPLTAAQQATLNTQLAQARNVVKEFPTVAQAEAGGYRESTPYVPCIGAHYTNIGYASNFDPAHPSELLYDGTSPTSKIVGLSYLVWHHGGPPPGFAGPNDRWHQHNANGGLCLKGAFVIAGEESTRQQCANMGGSKTLLTDVWMVHAWVAPVVSCDWGTFSGECPALGGKLGGTAFDGPYPSKFS